MTILELDALMKKEGNCCRRKIRGTCPKIWARRNEHLGHWCGYVISKRKLRGNYSIHGGITREEKKGHSYIYGFDCAHFQDVSPYLRKTCGDHYGPISKGIYHQEYRTIKYVMKELYDWVKEIKLDYLSCRK